MQSRLGSSGECLNCCGIDFEGFFGPLPGHPAIPSIQVKHAILNEELCRFCGLLVRALRRVAHLNHIVDRREWPTDNSPTEFISFFFERDYIPPIHNDSGVEMQYGSAMEVHVYPPPSPLSEDNVSFKLCPIFAGQNGDRQISARFVFEDQIDLPLCGTWLHECLELHPAVCQDRSQILQHNFPGCFRVIDVDNNCISQQSPACQYAALSYVWGEVESLQLRLSNVAELETLYGLRAKESNVAKTILDAVEVVKAIGLKYLWVDSLCIVQDSPDKEDHIRSMNGIYGSAAVTIVAASGYDANTGLAGVRPGSRHLLQMKQEVWPNIELALSLPPPEGSLDSVWASRAWTFQEQMLSQRFLIFRDGQVLWQCPSCVQYEDTVSEHKAQPHQQLRHVKGSWTDDNHLKQTSDTDPLRPDHLRRPKVFSEYASVVAEYSKKRLTYSDDILNAFQGLSRILEGRFPSNFIFGLPEAYLEVALLWLPSTILERREAHGKKFPSWSWAGWIGQVGFEDTEDSRRERVVPLQKWYLKEGDSDSVLINKVGIGIDENKMNYAKSANTFLWFPLQEARMNMMGSVPRMFMAGGQETYLQFWTSAAYFETMHNEDTRGSANAQEASLVRPKKTLIKSRSGQVVGYLVLNGSGPLETVLGRHELIILSEAQFSGFNPITWANTYSEECLMYNVMLIEWNEVHSIAARLGLGRIHKNAWRGPGATGKFVTLR